MNRLVCLIIFTCLQYVRGDFKLQILHTNDMHARFEEVDENTVSCTPAQAKENKCYGGFARIRQAAIEFKEEAKKRGIPSIFLNAGDTFQGTLYYNFYKWNITAPLVDIMEFDAMCLGNHEFDDGIDNLVQYLAHISVPTVTTNLNFSTDPRLNETNIKKSVQLNVKGVKIGIVGYLTPKTMKLSETENLQILDEFLSVQEEAKRLKSNGTQLIIALGHSGFLKDQELAKEIEEVDVIVGGHSHSLLHTPKDKPPSTEAIVEVYPYWVTQKSGKKVPIVQASAFTKYLGRLIITLDNNSNVIAAEGNSVLLDHTYAKNEELENQIKLWTSTLNTRLKTVLGSTRVSLRASNLSSIHLESSLPNLITDAFIEKSVFLAKDRNLSQWTRHAAALYLNSGIRAQIDYTRNEGNLTVEDIFAVIPFQNQILECSLLGSSLKDALEESVQNFDHGQVHFENFLHFSGLRVVYDLRKAPKNRVHCVKVICTDCSQPKYEKLDDNKFYTIILDSYVLKGTKQFSIGANCKNVTKLDPSGLSTFDIVTEYIRRHRIVYPILDGRIQMHGY